MSWFYSNYCGRCQDEWKCNEILEPLAESAVANSNPNFLDKKLCGFKPANRVQKYCKGCKKYVSQYNFLTSKGIICASCQLLRITKIINQPSF